MEATATYAGQRFVTRPSGLTLPAAPRKPQRTYGPLEIRDEDRRAATREALVDLWHAADLSRDGLMQLPGDEALDLQREMWDLLAMALLGIDAPEMEIKT